MHPLPWLRHLLALLFGGVFVYAGALKLRDPSMFLNDIRSFDLLPDPYAAGLALGLPWLEVFAGFAVITGILRQGGLLLLNAALVGFFIAIGSAWWRGLDITCGCFGGDAAKSNYTELFVRDGILLALDIALLWLFKPARPTST
jgi:uncharacterized membrane protein YphA (DoxX/SURF4 family)